MEKRKPNRTISLFVPEEFFGTLEVFEKLIRIDERIDKKNIKSRKRLMSIKIRQLINIYVNKYKENLRKNQDETHKDKNKEENKSANKIPS